MTLDHFMRHIASLPRRVEAEAQHALRDGAKLVQDEAKAELGTYQSAAGPFPAWQQLSPATLASKTGPGPLVETGELRDSIEADVQHNSAFVGSDEPHAKPLELGTSKMPARSYLGRAAYVKSDEVFDRFKRAVVKAIKP